MSTLRLALLGAPDVCHGEVALTFRTRKALALLAYLAAQGGLHSREALAALFWPESPETQARSTLRSTLNYLRVALGEQTRPDATSGRRTNRQDAESEGGRPAERDETAPHLLVTRDRLGLDPASAVDLDIRLVESAASAWGDPGADRSGPFTTDVVANLRSAADAYRGEFLAGFSLPDAPAFDDWASLQRERWHRRMSTVFDRLAESYLATGETGLALDVASRWVALDPLSEDAYRRLLGAQLVVGDRAGGLRTFEACRAMLAREFSAKPSLETVALVERVSDLVPRKPALLARRPASGPPLPEMPLVGRMGEYTRLVEAYQAAAAGRPNVVALVGEAGVGKTRLATEVLRWARAQWGSVLQGRAFETAGGLPFQPLSEALRARLAREAAPEKLLGPIWLAELSRLLPELRERVAGLEATSGAGPDSLARLFEAVARLIRALATRAPLVLFLDDVQWADTGSLDAVRYAARRLSSGREGSKGARVLLLLALRREAIGRSDAASRHLADWLDGLGQDLPSARLDLEPLTAEDTAQMIRILAGRRAAGSTEATGSSQVAEVVGRWLHERTHGQPFFIVETVRALVDRRIVTVRAGSDGDLSVDFAGAVRADRSRLAPASELVDLVPPGIREAVGSRLSRLGPGALALAGATAVVGQRVTFELACEVAGLDEDEGLRALDELVAGRLLGGEGIETRSAELAYDFSHDLTWEVIREVVGEARRRVYHRRAYVALDRAGAPAAVLAHHALGAGLDAEAFRHSLDAGDAALQLSAARPVIEHYERARGLVEGQLRGQVDAASVAHLYAELGRASQLASDLPRAHAAYSALLVQAREVEDISTEVVALNRLATVVVHQTGSLEAATALVEEARVVAESSGDRTGLAESQWNVAQLGYYAARPREVLPFAESALSLARELGRDDLVARALNALAYLQHELGYPTEAELIASEARSRYASLGDRAMEADCLSLVAAARLAGGNVAGAVSAGRSAIAACREIENAWGWAFGATHLGIALRDAGEYGEALAIAREGVDVARDRCPPPLLVMGLITLGSVCRALGDLESARSAHAEAGTLGDAMPSRPFAGEVEMALCADCALLGDWPTAATHARIAIATRARSLHLHEDLQLHLRTESLLRSADVELAENDLRGLAEPAERSPRLRVAHLRATASYERHHGRLDRAASRLNEAVRLADEIGLAGEVWSLRGALGDLRRALGDEEEARRLLSRAADEARGLSVRILQREARDRFLASEQVRGLLGRGD